MKLSYLLVPLMYLVMNHFNPGHTDLYIVMAVIYVMAAKYDDNRKEDEENSREYDEKGRVIEKNRK